MEKSIKEYPKEKNTSKQFCFRKSSLKMSAILCRHCACLLTCYVNFFSCFFFNHFFGSFLVVPQFSNSISSWHMDHKGNVCVLYWSLLLLFKFSHSMASTYDVKIMSDCFPHYIVKFPSKWHYHIKSCSIPHIKFIMSYQRRI